MERVSPSSNSGAAMVWFLALTFGLCWMFEIAAALAEHHLIRVCSA
jgi:hypothetical protein